MEVEKLFRDIQKQPEQFAGHREKILSIPETIASAVKRRPVVMTGISTSLSALKLPLWLLNRQGDFSAELVNTGDLLDYGCPQREDTRPLIVLSRSGESAETVRLLETVKADRCVIGVTEGAESALAKRADVLLAFRADEEAFPNTSSFTLSQLYGLGMAFGLGYHSSVSLDELVKEAACAAQEIGQKEDESREIGKMLSAAGGILIEGQGGLTGIVEQYCLDFHETQTLAVPVTGGTMRHGVIELTQREDVAVLMLVPEDGCTGKKFRLARELFQAGKKVAVLTNSAVSPGEGMTVFRLPPCPPELLGIVFTLGMQMVYKSFVQEKGMDSLQPDLVGKVTRRE